MEIRNNTNQSFGSKVILPIDSFRAFQSIPQDEAKNLKRALNRLEKNGVNDTVTLNFKKSFFSDWDDAYTMTVTEKRGKDLYIGESKAYLCSDFCTIGNLYKAARADMYPVKEKPNCLLKFFV